MDVDMKVSETRKKQLKRVSRGGGFIHTTLCPQNTWLLLSLAAPQRELREAKEDGIKRKDGMYDLEQSSRRNKSIIINADHRMCLVRRFLLSFQLQLRLRRVHVQSAAFHLRLCLCLSFCLGFGFYFRFSGSLRNLDPCDARVRGCVCTCALAVAVVSIAGLGLFTGRLRVRGSVGGYRRSILIVDRFYYRIIRLGLLFLSVSLCFGFLFLSLLLLYIRKDIG